MADDRNYLRIYRRGRGLSIGEAPLRNDLLIEGIRDRERVVLCSAHRCEHFLNRVHE